MPPNFKRVRTRDPDEAIAELEQLGKVIAFVDPNLSIYPLEFLERIFRYMERTRKIWIGEGSMRELAANPEIWDPMSRTCIGMLTGIESEKIGGNGRKKYEGAFLVQRNGAIVLDSVIIGHPSQTKEATIEMLESLRNGNRTCAFHMLTPYPGTKEYRTFTEQKRYWITTFQDMTDDM